MYIYLVTRDQMLSHFWALSVTGDEEKAGHTTEGCWFCLTWLTLPAPELTEVIVDIVHSISLLFELS